MTTQGSSLFAHNYGQEPEWGQERPITFEDLGIPRSQAMRATVFGNVPNTLCFDICRFSKISD